MAASSFSRLQSSFYCGNAMTKIGKFPPSSPVNYGEYRDDPTYEQRMGHSRRNRPGRLFTWVKKGHMLFLFTFVYPSEAMKFQNEWDKGKKKDNGRSERWKGLTTSHSLPTPYLLLVTLYLVKNH